jgi:hypothetical protein
VGGTFSNIFSENTMKTTSAAHIQFPTKPLADNAYERLRDLRDACGPTVNINDRVLVLIHGCLDEGINTRPSIIETLYRLGFNNRHVAMILKTSVGNEWLLGPEGAYRHRV